MTSAGTLAAPTLRDYQRAAHDGAWACWDAGKERAAVLMPTATGKTFVGAAIAATARDRGVGPCLFVAESLPLLEQWAEAMDAFGLSFAFEQADQRALSAGFFGEPPDAVLAMRQTLQGRRLASWPRDRFGLVATDEAHHWPSASHQAIDRHFAAPRKLGLTATPDRADGGDLRAHFAVAFEYSLPEAIRDGWVKRLWIERIPCGVDLRDIRTTRRADGGEDLDPKELARLLAPHLEALTNAAAERLKGRPAICFTPDVGSAQAAASAFRAVGVPADWASGERPEKATVLRGYRTGAFQVLCNADLTKEGFDAPRCAAVVLFRKTKSRALMSQMIGRGLRLDPAYEDCLVLDPACLTGRLQPVHPAEVACPGASEELLRRACALVDSGEESDPQQAEARARKEIEEARAEAAEAARLRREMSVRVDRRPVAYRLVAYDPFPLVAAGGIGLVRVPEEPPHRRRPLSDWQRATLQGEFGFQQVDTISELAAGRLIGALRNRRAKGLASHRQVGLLMDLGVPRAEALTLSAAEASSRIDRLKEGRKGA